MKEKIENVFSKMEYVKKFAREIAREKRRGEGESEVGRRGRRLKKHEARRFVITNASHRLKKFVFLYTGASRPRDRAPIYCVPRMVGLQSLWTECRFVFTLPTSQRFVRGLRSLTFLQVCVFNFITEKDDVRDSNYYPFPNLSIFTSIKFEINKYSFFNISNTFSLWRSIKKFHRKKCSSSRILIACFQFRLSDFYHTPKLGSWETLSFQIPLFPSTIRLPKSDASPCHPRHLIHLHCRRNRFKTYHILSSRIISRHCTPLHLQVK